jgi:hypothetical protein
MHICRQFSSLPPRRLRPSWRCLCQGCSCRPVALPTRSCWTLTPCRLRPWAGRSMCGSTGAASHTSTLYRHRWGGWVALALGLAVQFGVLASRQCLVGSTGGASLQPHTDTCRCLCGHMPVNLSGADTWVLVVMPSTAKATTRV